MPTSNLRAQLEFRHAVHALPHPAKDLHDFIASAQPLERVHLVQEVQVEALCRCSGEPPLFILRHAESLIRLEARSRVTRQKRADLAQNVTDL